jgi:hypothetical protein
VIQMVRMQHQLTGVPIWQCMMSADAQQLRQLLVMCSTNVRMHGAGSRDCCVVYAAK